MLRIARRLAAFPDETLYDAVQRACLTRFLPRLARTTLDQLLAATGVPAPSQAERETELLRDAAWAIRQQAGAHGQQELVIGDVAVEIKPTTMVQFIYLH